MTETFRLLQAASTSRRDFADAPLSHQHQVVELSDKFASSTKPWVTIVIGKNGVGKSRLLAGIASLFDFLDPASRLSRPSGEIWQLTYKCDGKLCEIDLSNGRYISVDGKLSELSDLPLPTKVIALTTTPFDKFRVPRSALPIPTKRLLPRVERYAYLGLRDRTGRASPTATIFRALEGLFEVSKGEDSRRRRVAKVFEFLGYRPWVDVHYEFGLTGQRRLDLIIEGRPLEEILDEGSSRSFRDELIQLLERDPHVLEKMRDVGAQALKRAGGKRTFSIRADFTHLSNDESFFSALQMLRKVDVVRMKKVEIHRIADDVAVDLKVASSGELGIVAAFLGIASVIEDGSLVLIDEPEISLHPEWQSRYIDLLLNTFSPYTGCHFVLATHSPLILADISPENSNVVLLEGAHSDAESARAFAGQSSDHLLVTAFQAPGKNNLYMKQEVIKALRLAADGKANSPEFFRILNELKSLLPDLEPDSPVTKLILELHAVQTASLTER